MHVKDVVSGKACNCFCYECGSILIAKKGEVKSDHFAHHPDSVTDCNAESEIHLNTKLRIRIEFKDKISIPDAKIEIGDKHYSIRNLFLDVKYWSVEKRVDNKYKPDLIAHCEDIDILGEYFGMQN